MADSLAHRGPDDAGYPHADGPCGLGFRRLSVIDLLTGNQPIRSDGARAIILNGEIYNYTELRTELTAKGRRFLTNSDTEVALAAYERDGVDCAASLRGMFAFAIWDCD